MTQNYSVYSQFKPYTDYVNPKQTNKKINYKALIGSVAGLAAATAINLSTNKAIANNRRVVKAPILKEVSQILLMAGLTNIGGVIGGSIGKSKEEKRKKLKEAGFEIMNTTIPMLLVTGATVLCNNIKALNKIPIKIAASLGAMSLGGLIATTITNSDNPKGEKRKYTPQDALANFDDIIATIKIGFSDFAKKVPVDKILPFIYVYNGYRSGSKE